MKKRNKHNATVKKVAAGYKSQGWKVAADIVGYPKPKTIYRRRPDVIARKDKKERIVEVETPSSFKREKNQRRAFKRYSSKKKSRKFRTKIIRG